MEDTQKIFIAGLKLWAKYNKVTQADIGKALGRDQTTISNYYTGSTRIPIESIKVLVEAFKLDYDDILETGRQQGYATQQEHKSEKNVLKFKSQIEKDHFAIIQTFEDPETALSFNSFLSRLEKLDVAKYEEIYGKVRGIVRELEQKTPPSEDTEKTGTSGE